LVNIQQTNNLTSPVTEATGARNCSFYCIYDENCVLYFNRNETQTFSDKA